MTDEEFSRLAAAEDEMWYFLALRDHLWRCLQPLAEGHEVRKVLDAGCGTGGWLRELQRRAPSWELHGVDCSEVALGWARRREAQEGARTTSRQPLTYHRGDVSRLAFEDNSFDAVTCPDVLCLIEDLPAALAEMTRVLRPGGVLVATVPAYRWLRSYHDIAVGGRHRFRRGQWAGLASQAGLVEASATYWNVFTLPAIVWQRKIAGEPKGGDVQLRSAWLEGLLRGAMSVELAWVRRGLTWPLGASLVFVGRKPHGAGEASPGSAPQ